jgi:GT2 family glycosyltransferase
VEVIVVDDGSTDDTARVAENAGARVLDSGGRGPAAARNLGARHARGDVLIFLDADTAPRSGWLREMLAPLADPSIVAVKGRYDTIQRSVAARFAQLEFEEKYARLERAPSVDFVDTGTATYRREAFLAAGGFNESFPASSAEDVELAFRLAARGARFAFNPRAVVLHRHSESLLSYLTKKTRYGFFRVRVYRHHPDKALGDSYTPRTMALQIGLAGLLGASAILSLLGCRVARPPALASVGAFLLSTLPLVGRAIRQDRPLAPLVPVLVLARSTAQGLGILGGLLAVGHRRNR